MKRVAICALILATPAYAEAPPDYPPGLFEHSPETGTDHSKRWTHMPDGRWMFVDPDQTQGKMCDLQHHCYSDAPAAAAVPAPALSPNIPPAVWPNGEPSAHDPWCLGIAQRLFASFAEVQAAHARCDHSWQPSSNTQEIEQ